MLITYASEVPFFEECPLNFLVGENSPNLCPTIDSVTNTGKCSFPLCTSKVIPTISGVIVDLLAHVLMGLFSLVVFIFSTFSINLAST